MAGTKRKEMSSAERKRRAAADMEFAKKHYGEGIRKKNTGKGKKN